MDTGRLSLGDLPFDERRYIAVVSDEDFAKKVKSEEQGGFTSAIWPILGSVGSTLVSGPDAVLTFAASKYLSPRYTMTERQQQLAPASAETQAQTVEKKPSSGAVRVVRMRDAKDLTVMSGSVEIGGVYAAHPLVTRIYYSVETYNDDLLDHKLSELERIINSLGATSYSIKFEEQANLLSKLSASASSKFWKRGKVAAALQQSRKRRFERSGTADGRDPVLPDN